jgi:hypothetical protein
MTSVTSYAERPLTHRVNNIGDSLFRLIGITNASPGDSNETPSPGFEATPELTNRWFRGYRHVLGTKPTPEHRHANPVVLVVAAGSASVRLGASESRTLGTPGSFVLVEPNAPHTIAGTSPDTHVVEVEIRRPR